MKNIALLISILCFTTFFAHSQDLVSGNMNARKQKLFEKKLRKDSIRAHKKVWTSILGGPSYTPEASVGVGGAILMSFRIDSKDTISQRSFLPMGFNVSVNGTFILAGAGSLFFNENKFRIYTNYGYRNEPTNFFGIGFDQIDGVEQGEETTQYYRTEFELYPRFVWEVKPDIYIGTLLKLTHNSSRDEGTVLTNNDSFKKYGDKYMNIGLGGMVQYDTRDDVATPTNGILVSATGTIYSKLYGSNTDFQMFELEYRQFMPMFNRRSTLAWITKTKIGLGDIPYASLPMFGSPFDLRGYTWGKYRDKTMAYGIVEYRHMFGSQTDYDRGSLLAKMGAVAWVGTGTLGNKAFVDWNEYKLNYGIGLRIQIQPGKNFRLDMGKEPGQKWAFYMNMTEAF